MVNWHDLRGRLTVLHSMYTRDKFLHVQETKSAFLIFSKVCQSICIECKCLNNLYIIWFGFLFLYTFTCFYSSFNLGKQVSTTFKNMSEIWGGKKKFSTTEIRTKIQLPNNNIIKLEQTQTKLANISKHNPFPSWQLAILNISWIKVQQNSCGRASHLSLFSPKVLQDL